MWTKKLHLGLLCAWLVIGTANAQNKVLIADARPRPPEIFADEKTGVASGPWVAILDEAAKKIGYSVQWRIVPFTRALEEAKNGSTDIVPGIYIDEDRKSYMEFVGPVGTEHSPVRFLVREGQEHQLKSYEDLKKMRIGIKRGSIYFPQFDQDKSIQRVASQDDDNMVKMLVAGRFDAMIVNNVEAASVALERNQIRGTAWAEYKPARAMPRYYGISKRTKHNVAILGPALAEALKAMGKSGRIAEIYQQHGLNFKEWE
jgi:polar amino acid transport system substrate-binding protein